MGLGADVSGVIFTRNMYDSEGPIINKFSNVVVSYVNMFAPITYSRIR